MPRSEKFSPNSLQFSSEKSDDNSSKFCHLKNSSESKPEQSTNVISSLTAVMTANPLISSKSILLSDNERVALKMEDSIFNQTGKCNEHFAKNLDSHSKSKEYESERSMIESDVSQQPKLGTLSPDRK